MIEIRTERLLLRPARATDLDALHAVFGDPRAMLYWSTPPHASVEQTREWLSATFAIPPGEGSARGGRGFRDRA